MKQTNHDLNQCANDWIMCKCGKLFSDNKTSNALDKFTNHLTENKEIALAMYYDSQITKRK